MAEHKKKRKSLSESHPELVKEWDYEKNAPFTPDMVSAGSEKQFWWICEHGHNYLKRVNKQTTAIVRCPYCSNHAVLKGFNDLASAYPDLTKEWNYEKNKDITPDKVLASSHKKVWWKCKYGHEWEAIIDNRVRNGHTCPYCSGHKAIKGISDLATLNPLLAEEWDYEKNGQLKPSDVKQFSAKKVWWKCSRGHSWKVSVANRSIGNGCPFCAGQFVIKGENDLATINPYLAKEWNYDKNAPLTPEMVSASSKKKVWWKCIKEHEWQAALSDRNRGNGCPYCSNRKSLIGYNDLATLYPEIAKEWNYDKNQKITPFDVTYSSSKSVWWICERGHEWKTSIRNRSSGSGCPLCSNNGSSIPEQGIAYYLSKCVEVKQRIKIKRREIDIYLPRYKLGIEYDGYFYHKNKQAQDLKKTEELKNAGIYILRMVESDHNSVTDDVIYYKFDNIGKNYEWALKNLIQTVSTITGNNDFKSVSIDVRRDRLAFRERFSLVQKKNSLATKKPSLAKEWNYEKNGILEPNMFGWRSGEAVWWKCSKGHEWKAVIASRTSGRGCPYCANQKLLVGYNDLVSMRPELVKEWNYDKNVDLMPQNFTFCSEKKVWWKCNKGHEWRTSIRHRSSGTGCPYCLGLRQPPILCVETGQIYESAGQAARQTGANRVSICRCCKGIQKTAGGYHWKNID